MLISDLRVFARSCDLLTAVEPYGMTPDFVAAASRISLRIALTTASLALLQAPACQALGDFGRRMREGLQLKMDPGYSIRGHDGQGWGAPGETLTSIRPG